MAMTTFKPVLPLFEALVKSDILIIFNSKRQR